MNFYPGRVPFSCPCGRFLYFCHRRDRWLFLFEALTLFALVVGFGEAGFKSWYALPMFVPVFIVSNYFRRLLPFGTIL
jgi:hypothetical protein